MLFCQPSPLQLTLYRQLVRSNLIRRLLSGNCTGGAPHLICIGALKQLCNHPGLTYRKAAEVQMEKEANEQRGATDDQDKVFEVRPFVC